MISSGDGMHSSRNASTTVIREINRKQVLSCIRQSGPMPRVDIVNRTGLSKPTVTRVIEQLISEGLLVETGIISTSRGRHPINVDINASARYVIGVNLSKNTMGVALVNFGMHIVEKRLTSIKEISSTKELLAAISDMISELLESNKVDKSKVLGVGIGVPGLVDCAKGIVKDFALSGKLRDIPLARYLEDQFHFPVLIDNNCNTRMLGEYYFGYAVGCKNAMFILNSEGVGCGLVMDGKLYNKLNNTTSGFGHLCVNVDGPKCRCGGYGCVEAYCSTEEIEKKAYERLCAKNKGDADNSIAIPSYRYVCNSIAQGDMTFVSILVEAAQAMASGLVSMINLFNPETIILSGNMFDASDFYYNKVIEELGIRMGNANALPRIVRRRVQDALYEIGAATIILQKVF
ncbi:MAG: ROK family transcriptional regulator [Bacillota bacterium]